MASGSPFMVHFVSVIAEGSRKVVMLIRKMDSTVPEYMKTIAFIWRENMVGYVSLEISYSENRKVFGKGSLRKTISFEDYVQGKIAEDNFVPNGGYCA